MEAAEPNLPLFANYLEHPSRRLEPPPPPPPPPPWTQGDAPPPGSGHLGTRLFQQSVTMTAKMWPDGGGGTAAPSGGAGAGGWRWGAWRVPAEYLPLLVGTVCGGALLLLLLAAAVVWRCCVVPRRDKAYCARMAEELAARQRGGAPALPSHSAVFAAPKSGHWAYSSRLVGGPRPADPAVAAAVASAAAAAAAQGQAQGAGPPPPHWASRGAVPRSVAANATSAGADPHALAHAHAHHAHAHHARAHAQAHAQPMPRSASCGHGREPCCQQMPSTSGIDQRRRPVSQPIKFGPCDPVSSEIHCHHLPEISEFNAQSNQYASSSILDEVGTRGTEPTPGPATLKTRSLPAWVRSRSRPLSTEDDLAELYAKVNFSKKRKNRMRNDEAAIIALSKSRSQYLHKDTDSLVNNEAVIVYDERTAL
ncbi:hypothetical protein R5R35_003682 [Gryllus longicercus]|uniref:Uncharacterized protein n=1 Tax=Gryllus longicercus TaxID=2509291 RepID=A0AAN9V2F2_9ORTH